MLDRYIAQRTLKKVRPSEQSYDTSQALASSQLYNEHADRLAVVFAPWHGSGLYGRRFVKRLVKSGSAVLDLEFHDNLLEANAPRVIASFASSSNEIINELKAVNSRHNYQALDFISVSLGTVVMVLVSEKVTDFTSVTMVVPGSSLARGVWQGQATQNIRDSLEQQGYTEESLDEEWQSLRPSEHVACFTGKPVHVVTSLTDQIVPPQLQQEMVDDLRMAGANVTVNTSNLGHYAAAARYYLFDKLSGQA